MDQLPCSNRGTAIHCCSTFAYACTGAGRKAGCRQAGACLYLRGNCFRMSRTEEMAYSPVSSVRIMTKLVVLPAPDTAKKNCT